MSGDLKGGRLVRVLSDWCAPFSGYHLYYPNRRQPTQAFALLVEALRYRGAIKAVQKSCRPCQKAATHQALPLYRGLRPLGAEKIEKNRSQHDRMEIPVEFSHGLLELCTASNDRSRAIIDRRPYGRAAPTTDVDIGRQSRLLRTNFGDSGGRALTRHQGLPSRISENAKMVGVPIPGNRPPPFGQSRAAAFESSVLKVLAPKGHRS